MVTASQMSRCCISRATANNLNVVGKRNNVEVEWCIIVAEKKVGYRSEGLKEGENHLDNI